MSRDAHVERPGHCAACAARLDALAARLAALEPPPGYRPAFALDEANLARVHEAYAQIRAGAGPAVSGPDDPSCIYCGHANSRHHGDRCHADGCGCGAQPVRAAVTP